MLGVDADGVDRKDKHLPEIVALLDKRQFDLISSPASSVLVVKGGAGSGKTTVGLHRIAYLVFADEKRFRPKDELRNDNGLGSTVLLARFEVPVPLKVEKRPIHERR